MTFGGVQAVGLWSTLYAVVMLLKVGDAGMASALQRFIAAKSLDSDLVEIRQLFLNGFIINFFILLLMSIVFLLLTLNYVDMLVNASLYGDDLDALICVMFFSFFLFNLSNVVFGAIIGIHKYFKKSVISVACNCINIVSVFFLVPLFGLLGFAIAQLIYCFTMFIAAFIVVFIEFEMKCTKIKDLRFTVMKVIMNFSVKGYVSAVPHNLVEPVTKILLGSFSSSEIQGIYEIAYKTVFLTRNAIVSGVLAVLPSITSHYSQKDRNIKPLIKGVINKSFKSLMCVYAAIAILCPIISLLWLGSIDYDYIAFVYILICTHIITGSFSVTYMIPNVNGVFVWNTLFGWCGLALIVFIGMIMPYTQMVLEYPQKYVFICLTSVIICLVSVGIHKYNMKSI